MQLNLQHPDFPDIPFDRKVTGDFIKIHAFAWRGEEPLFCPVAVTHTLQQDQDSDSRVCVPNECWFVKTEMVKAQTLLNVDGILVRAEYVRAARDVFQYAAHGNAFSLVGSNLKGNPSTGYPVYPCAEINNPFTTNAGRQPANRNAGGVVIAGQSGIGECLLR